MHRMLAVAAAGLAALVVADAARAEPPEGDWLGVLKTPTYGDLTMTLHLTKAGAGFEGVMDDVTLGARDMAVANVEAAGDRLAFDIPRAKGHYEATWDAAAHQWAGTWKSPGLEAGAPLRLARGAAPPPPHVEGLDGDWQGALNTGPGGVLRLVMHIKTTDPGGTRVTMDSPDQGAAGVPAPGITRQGREVEVDIRPLQARIFGELSEDGTSIQGEFDQGPSILPLILKRGGDFPPTPAGTPAAAAALPTVWTPPDDAAIRQVLARRIDHERRGVGIAVGVITPQGRRVVTYGALDVGDPRKVDGDTLFEIGSISKPFTSLILQDMALKGQIGLDDPVARYLPPGTHVPSRNGKEITLRELATHTAGLPHDLPNALAKRAEDIFGMTSEADLYKFLATYQLPRDPGAEWEYSNLGVGMLGLAISHRAGVDLETLIRQRVTGPLGMTSTVMTVTPELQARLAVGHDAFLHPEPPIAIGPAEAAAGLIRSSANDMLKLLAAEMGYVKTPLKPAMDAMLVQERPGMQGGFRQALGWMLLDMPSGRLVTHSGGTFGHRAFAAFNPKTRVGVIVLSNAEGSTGADDIGMWLAAGVSVRPLAPAPLPLRPAARQARAELPMNANAARPYLGRYRMSRSVDFVLGYAGGRLVAHAEVAGRNAGPELPVTWYGGEDFSAPNGGNDIVDIAAQRDATGRASTLIWRGPVGEFVLRRIGDAPAG